jgi:hypothetical protein
MRAAGWSRRPRDCDVQAERADLAAPPRGPRRPARGCGHLLSGAALGLPGITAHRAVFADGPIEGKGPVADP